MDIKFIFALIVTWICVTGVLCNSKNSKSRGYMVSIPVQILGDIAGNNFFHYTYLSMRKCRHYTPKKGRNK